MCAYLVCTYLPLEGGGASVIKTVAGVCTGGLVYVACLLLSGEMKPEIEMLRQARRNRQGD